jgi:hypothetical protein
MKIEAMRVLAVALPVAALAGTLYGYLWKVHAAPFFAKKLPFPEIWFPDFQ